MIFRQHSNQEFSDSKKSVTVQVGEKVKVPGQSKKKGTPSANLDLPRAFLTCREEGRERLDLSKSNISSLPASLRELTHLTELYLYSNRSVIPVNCGKLRDTMRTFLLGAKKSSFVELFGHS